jgi:hypothetical protein
VTRQAELMRLWTQLISPTISNVNVIAPAERIRFSGISPPNSRCPELQAVKRITPISTARLVVLSQDTHHENQRRDAPSTYKRWSQAW